MELPALLLAALFCGLCSCACNHTLNATVVIPAACNSELTVIVNVTATGNPSHQYYVDWDDGTSQGLDTDAPPGYVWRSVSAGRAHYFNLSEAPLRSCAKQYNYYTHRNIEPLSVACNSPSPCKIQFTIAGGTANFVFSLTGNFSEPITNRTTFVPPGNYYCYAQDAIGCTSQSAVPVSVTDCCNGNGKYNADGICVCQPGFNSSTNCLSCSNSSYASPFCYITFPGNGHDYILVTQNANFTTAAQVTSYPDAGWYLATITTESEAKFIQQNWGGQQFWVGGHDFKGQGTWNWATGPEPNFIFYQQNQSFVPGMYHNFSSPPIPNQIGATSVDPTGAWISSDPTLQLYYLLERGGSAPAVAETENIIFNIENQHYYQVGLQVLNWDDASATARERKNMNQSGYLVTLNTPQELNFLFQNMPTGVYWTGGSEAETTGEYKWITKENTTYFLYPNQCVGFCFWAIGEPNRASGLEHNMIFGIGLGYWVDVQNNITGYDNNTRFIVEYDCGCNGHGNCTVNKTCSCFDGFSGTYCEDHSIACTEGDFCIKNAASFLCYDSPTGYFIKNGKCEDINECLSNNGLCDYHTNCTNTDGSRICGDCPTGFLPGNGNQPCLSLCGDGMCEEAIGENCVTCRHDCTSPCGLCGDGACTESCSTCSEDCGLCVILMATCCF